MSRYQTMLDLKNQLDELLSNCGLEVSSIKIHPVRAPQRMVEALGHDRALCGYLDALRCQIQKASKTMEDLKIDLWNMEQDAQRMETLEQNLAEYQKRCDEMEQTQENDQKQLAELKDALAQAKQKQVDSQILIQAVIGMRDHLLMRRDWLQDQDPDNVNAAKLIDGQLRETRKLLEGAGVEILDQGGRFDCNFQMVVDTRPAPTPEQVDEIADIFRPGYRFGGEVIRAQEVIVYV